VVRVDTITSTADVDGRRVELTPTQCAVLSYLEQAKPRPIRADEMLVNVWGYPPDAALDVSTVRMVIMQLRRKLGADAIRSRLRIGYSLR
jgi:DNA-binding response OmpR family regulator